MYVCVCGKMANDEVVKIWKEIDKAWGIISLHIILESPSKNKKNVSQVSRRL
jgi:hypothetical protein